MGTVAQELDAVSSYLRLMADAKSAAEQFQQSGAAAPHRLLVFLGRERVVHSNADLEEAVKMLRDAADRAANLCLDVSPEAMTVLCLALRATEHLK